MNVEKISVIMPVYNAEQYLKEAIEDILSQSLCELELICVDDGSVDKSRQIINEYAKKDNRVKLIVQTNKGAGAARNLGLSVAKGKYLLFLDADDRFEKDMLECTYRKAEATDAEIVIFNGDRFDAFTNKRMAHAGLLDYSTYEKHLDGMGRIVPDNKNDIIYNITNSTVWNKLFLREFVEKNELLFQEIYVVDSMYFVMAALAIASNIVVLNDVLIHYRTNTPGGQISNHDKAPIGVYEAGVKVKEYLEEKNIFETLENGFLNYIMKNCMQRFQFFHTIKAEKMLYQILHEGGLQKLGIREDNITMICDEHCRNQIKQVMNLAYNEYLESKVAEWKESNLIIADMYRMPEFGLKMGDKVVLYGAGNVGKSYFTQIQNQRKWKLQGWVDKGYLQCGYPILNPEEIREWDVDAVIIAVLDKRIANEIAKYLRFIGVDEKQIYWDVPVQIG